MSTRTTRWVLHATVFLTGAAVLILEVLATRILAPYYGNTIYTVSSILGVVLGALSLGYYVGGRAADRFPSRLNFFISIIFAGISVLLIRTFSQPIADLLQGGADIRTGPIVASLCLFFAPAFFLGLLSPWAVKLQSLLRPDTGVGSASGEVFFYSTIGSIAGSFSAGFLLIPNFGVSAILTALGAGLTALGVAGAIEAGIPRRTMAVLLLMVLGGAYANSSAREASQPGVVFAKDGVYERITIMEGYYEERLTRFLKQNTNWSAGIFHGSDELAFDYARYIYLTPLFKPAPERALMIGGGAYSIPRALRAEWPDMQVDVSEIEPGLPEIAREYFRLEDDPKIATYIEDGRVFLARSTEPYDLIVGDIYYAPASVPVQFTTKEFFELVREKLNPNGIYMLNFIGSLPTESPSLLYSEIKTFRETFPNSYFFALDSDQPGVSQNFIFIGQKGDTKVDFRDPVIADALFPKLGMDVSARLMSIEEEDLAKEMIFTDDYAPVEHLTLPVIEGL